MIPGRLSLPLSLGERRLRFCVLSPPRARAEVKDASCQQLAASELLRRNLIQVYVLPVQLGTSRHHRRKAAAAVVVVVLGRDARFRNNDVYATRENCERTSERASLASISAIAYPPGTSISVL